MTSARIPDHNATEFARRLRERLGASVREVILFGSRARGNFDEHSDYDVLVLVDGTAVDAQVIVDEIAADLFVETSLLFPALVVLEREFERRLANPLFANVREEGVAL